MAPSSFAPAANYNGPVPTVTYTISDGNGGSATSVLNLGPVLSVNDAPVAVADTVTVTEDTPVSGNVLANDTDVDGNALVVAGFTIGGVAYPAGTSVALPEGTLVIAANGTFSFAPAANYNGPVPTVTYTISDGHGGSSTATVSVTVTPVNDAPVAVSDGASTAEDTPVTVAVLANDFDLEGDSLTVTAASAASGAVVINPDGSLTYTPSANFFGSDTITYSISDGNGGTATATVAVTVASVNDNPVALNDAASTSEDTPVSVAVLANDTDADGDVLTVTAASASNGTVVINPDGTLLYTPVGNFNGTDIISYMISDGNGGVVSATATITVAAVNDAPVANGDSAAVTEDTPVSGSVLANDTDVDGTPLTVTQFMVGGTVYAAGVTAVFAEGTLVIAADGSYTFTPAPNYNGPVPAVTYSIADGQGGRPGGAGVWPGQPGQRQSGRRQRYGCTQ